MSPPSQPAHQLPRQQGQALDHGCGRAGERLAPQRWDGQGTEGNSAPCPLAAVDQESAAVGGFQAGDSITKRRPPDSAPHASPLLAVVLHGLSGTAGEKLMGEVRVDPHHGPAADLLLLAVVVVGLIRGVSAAKDVDGRSWATVALFCAAPQRRSATASLNFTFPYFLLMSNYGEGGDCCDSTDCHSGGHRVHRINGGSNFRLQ